MRLSKQTLEALWEAYRTGMTVKELADKACCEQWIAAYYIERKELKSKVGVLRAEGLTYDEIGRMLRVSAATARKADHRVYDFL